MLVPNAQLKNLSLTGFQQYFSKTVRLTVFTNNRFFTHPNLGVTLGILPLSVRNIMLHRRFMDLFGSD